MSNAHKWLCAPKGSAFLYARPEIQHLVEPLMVSWGYESETPSPSRFVDEQEWTGTRDIAAYLATPSAINFCQEHHWDVVRSQCHTLVQYTRERINMLTGLPAICPDSVDWYMQMATMALPPCDKEKIKTRLYDEYRIEVPIVEWQGRQFLRVSVQAYNTREDVDRLVEALEEIIGRG